MILYINGSPKLSKSNSEYFIKKIDSSAEIKYLYKDKFDSLNLKDADTIILSFPLYVDAPSNKVIELLNI